MKSWVLTAKGSLVEVRGTAVCRQSQGGRIIGAV